jgi:dihydrofolate reductase
MGRVTYEEMAAHWPTSTDDYAAPMNEIPKVVFSKTLDKATWAESSIARGDLEDEIATLRRQPGGEIIAWGSASLAQSLSRAGLIDEYVLVIHPVAFGTACRCSETYPTRCSSNCSRHRHSTPAPSSTSTRPAIEPLGPAHERQPPPGCSRSRRDRADPCNRGRLYRLAHSSDHERVARRPPPSTRGSRSTKQCPAPGDDDRELLSSCLTARGSPRNDVGIDLSAP